MFITAVTKPKVMESSRDFYKPFRVNKFFRVQLVYEVNSKGTSHEQR